MQKSLLFVLSGKDIFAKKDVYLLHERHEESESDCSESEISVITKRVPQRCPDGFCLEGNCERGRTGILCAQCEPGKFVAYGTKACVTKDECSPHSWIIWPSLVCFWILFSM